MPTLEKLLDRKKEVSSQVSAQTRASAFGLLAISWAILTAHDEPLKTMASHIPSLVVLTMAIVATLILTFDLLQYVSYTAATDDAIDRAKEDLEKKAQYNTDSWWYRAGDFFYKAKFVLLILGGCLLVWSFYDLARSLDKQPVDLPRALGTQGAPPTNPQAPPQLSR